MKTATRNIEQTIRQADEYEAYLDSMHAHFKNITEPLFVVDMSMIDLYQSYLNQFDAGSERQYHTCSACRSFIHHFGNLVTIDNDGKLKSAMWSLDGVPEQYRESIGMMKRMVEGGIVASPFYTSQLEWGIRRANGWSHFLVRANVGAEYFRRPTVTSNHAYQSEKVEDYKRMLAARSDFDSDDVVKAIMLLRSGKLNNSQAVLGPAEFLRSLQEVPAGPHCRNVLWKKIEAAPAGFCHPRGGMLGTLLEDIAAGKSYDAIAASFNAKMSPLMYQRPQAAPSAGNIRVAEAMFTQLEASGSLRRRYARIEDIQEWLWVPPPPQNQPTGVFGHLTPKAPPLNGPAVAAITWNKFKTTVLPTAEHIAFYTKPGNSNFTGLTTAADPNAPPIIQWDHESARNPVSWYLWHGGAEPKQFNLPATAWVTVNGVTEKPKSWNCGNHPQLADGVIFILDGARDTKESGCGVGLFPAILKSEFHGVRSVIEAYSQRANLEERDRATACGLMLSANDTYDATFRVTAGGVVTTYKIDRWD